VPFFIRSTLNIFDYKLRICLIELYTLFPLGYHDVRKQIQSVTQIVSKCHKALSMCVGRSQPPSSHVCVYLGPNEVVNASAVLPIPASPWFPWHLPLHSSPFAKYTRKSNKTLTSVAVWAGVCICVCKCICTWPGRPSHPFEVLGGPGSYISH